MTKGLVVSTFEKYYAVAIYPVYPGVDLEDAAREVESLPAELGLDVLDFTGDEGEILVSRGASFHSTSNLNNHGVLREDALRAMPSIPQSPGPVPTSVTRVRDQKLVEFPRASVEEELEKLRLSYNEA
ncbi:hypothetical protein [Gordonia sihwensis]|uniref:hypothetical protein n=1 Tax=Gordonia sihwensis TaxID=173559 RepID=UPI003D980A2B